MLHPLGRDAVVTAGYAIASGSFVEGAHPPHAAIPFLVECWADAFQPEDQEEDRATCALFMNRTQAIAPVSSNTWEDQIGVMISGTSATATVPAGPHYSLTINITAPMFRMISDGKTPDARPFRTALADAIGKAARQAGRDIAAEMSSEQKRAASHQQRQQRQESAERRLSDREARQQRLARIKAEKAERKAMPSIRDVVLELLPKAVETEAASGFLFNTRRLVYRIRDEVQSRTGEELTQGYFDRLLTEIEAERGDLHPLLIREPRGNYSVPHSPEGAIPLGTENVRAFQRPEWVFNKIIVIEKEDLRRMLHQAGWDRRHDAMLISAVGFNTRAARDLIDQIAETAGPDGEPVRAFDAHDGDSSGTLIQDKLQNATLARPARKIEIIDLGLQPWEGIALDLAVEKVPILRKKDGEPKRRPVGAYVRARTDRAPNGETWEEWLQHSRVELNAFTSAELINWLDQKMIEHGAGKLIPPDDILRDGFAEHVRDRAASAVAEAIEQQLESQITDIKAEQDEATKDIRDEIDRITAGLRAQLAEVSAPFLERIEAAKAEAQAIDQDAAVERTIARITPDAMTLRSAIDAAFVREPTRPWSEVLHEIADATEVNDNDEGGGR